MYKIDRLGMSGLLVATVAVPEHEEHRVRLQAMNVKRLGRGRWRLQHRNGVVNTGLNIALDRLFGISGPPAAISNIALSSSTATVTAATTTLGGTVSFKTISPAASRTNQVVTAGATWTEADSPGPKTFVVTKVGLLNTATDAGTGLLDVIGGTGGSAPFNQPFTIDLTNVTTFSLVMQIQLTAANT